MQEIMQLSIAAAKENGFLNANTVLLAKAIWPALNQDHGLVGCIGEPRGIIEGMVVLHTGTLYYSDEPCLEEKVVFVRPEFRSAKGGRARQLCEFSKRMADSLSLPLLIGICSNERTKGKVRLYERIFGPPAGAYFLYGTKTGGHAVS
jgi:GNAT superfamily N-acetyltransferase